MATEQPGFLISLVATVTQASNLFKVVKQDTANPGNFILVAAATDSAIGILQGTPPANGTGTIMVSGVSKFIAQGTIHVGDDLGLTTSPLGSLKAIVAGTDTTIRKVGQSLSECADGDIGTGLFNFAAATRDA